jgi:tetratricopeptide (TPR) repeat protein
VTPQSVTDSLEIYNPFDQHDDIRRIINTEFTILGISNNSLIKKFQSDLKREVEKSDTLQAAKIHVKIGDIYFTTSIYDYALDSYFKALRIFESAKDTLNIAKTKLKLRRTYYFADLLPLEDYFSEVDELLKNSKDYESLALAFYVKWMLAKNEDEKKEFLEKALTIQSLVIAENPQDKSHKYYLANFLNAAGKLEESIKIAESIGDNWLLVLYLN